MKAIGVRRKDVGCCPGHDKHSKGYKPSRKSGNTKRGMRAAKRRSRGELFDCDGEVHVFVGRKIICSCGKSRLDD